MALRAPAEREVSILSWRVYERLPASADRLIHASQRYLLPLLRPRVPLRRLRGNTVEGRRSSVLVAGGGATLDYLIRRFFRAPPEAEPLGSVLLCTLPPVLRRHADDDLVLARVERPIARCLFDDRYLRVPEAVDMWLSIDRPDPLHAANSEVRRLARRIRESEMTWTVTHELSAFDRFYEKFYRPYARARFGEHAVIRARPVLRRMFRQGGLLWQWLDGQPVVGHVFRIEGSALRLVAIGIRTDADPEMRNRRLTGAGRLFAMDYGRDRRFTELGLGGSLPSLRDGVLLNKRAWGACLRDRAASSHDVLVRWSRLSEPVVRFLADVPLIFRTSDGFAAVTAVAMEGARHAESARTLWRQLAPFGLERLYVIGSGNGGTRGAGSGSGPARIWLAAPGAPEVVLSSARPCPS